MSNQTETTGSSETVLRAKETGARVVVKGGRFDCEGCGGGFASDIALKMARNHAEFCVVLPLD
ncbi:hypothetical protein [Streptomyces sp. NPDC057257]|uniref:hypothetical protein n=1 Tax=Streptomyces sp. NPDC057257 TaxID=3346071 RepID=UPI00362F889A